MLIFETNLIMISDDDVICLAIVLCCRLLTMMRTIGWSQKCTQLGHTSNKLQCSHGHHMVGELRLSARMFCT